jgi:REP element-mobilizing transposase RayT
MMSRMEHGHLPRLAREFYQRDAIVHWTLTLQDRATGWLKDSFHSDFRELMLHAAVRESLLCPTYCLMLDHLHLVWMGTNRESDQLKGMAFLRTHLEPLLTPHRFQHQPYDNVLRDKERERGAFAKVCSYILANPQRKELVKKPHDWRFRGAIVPGYPRLDPFEDDYWEKFWRIYGRRFEKE